MMGTGAGTETRRVPPSPYRGILPFSYADRHLFFGRGQEINDLTAKILLYRLVVVFGESGSGKSSLLNAGVWPALEKENLHGERLRVRPIAGAPLVVEPVAADRSGLQVMPSVFRPGKGDLSSRDSWAALPVEEFREALRAAPKGASPVLVFDQFEELFTLFEPDHRRLQKQVLDEMYALINSRDLVAKVVVVIREDFVGKLEALARQYPQVFDRRVRLSSLSPTAAFEAILGPFAPGHPFASRITPALASRIVGDFTGGDEETTVHSTQLQIVCSRLWEEFAGVQPDIGISHYQSLGGLPGILEGFLKAEIDQLPVEERDLAYTLMGQMVTPSGTRDVVSEERLRSAFAESPEAERVAFAGAGTLRYLEELRLINRTPQRGVYYYEISSEYLIAPIKAFNEARVHEEAERKAAHEAQAKLMELARQLELERVQHQVQEQTARAEQEAKAARRLRFLLAQLALLLMVAAGMAYLAIQQKGKAEQEQARAQSQARELAQALEENSRRLELFRNSIKLKQDALSGEPSRFVRAVQTSPTRIQFGVTAARKGQSPVYVFECFPLAETIDGGMSSVAMITYKLDHPTFKNTVLAAGPDRNFRAVYEGWGALNRVVAVVEYNDPDRQVEVGTFNMQEKLGW